MPLFFNSPTISIEIWAIFHQSDGSVTFDDSLLALNSKTIREMILDLKESSTSTSIFLPPNLVKFFSDVFATPLHPVFGSLIRETLH